MLGLPPPDPLTLALRSSCGNWVLSVEPWNGPSIVAEVVAAAGRQAGRLRDRSHTPAPTGPAYRSSRGGEDMLSLRRRQPDPGALLHVVRNAVRAALPELRCREPRRRKVLHRVRHRARRGGHGARPGGN